MVIKLDVNSEIRTYVSKDQSLLFDLYQAFD